MTILLLKKVFNIFYCACAKFHLRMCDIWPKQCTLVRSRDFQQYLYTSCRSKTTYFRMYLTISTAHALNLNCACVIYNQISAHQLDHMISNNRRLLHVGPNPLYFRRYLTFSTAHALNFNYACVIYGQNSAHWLGHMISNNSCLLHVGRNPLILEDI